MLSLIHICGRLSKGYKYSGSNNLGEVGWYWAVSYTHLDVYKRQRRLNGNMLPGAVKRAVGFYMPVVILRKR